MSESLRDAESRFDSLKHDWLKRVLGFDLSSIPRNDHGEDHGKAYELKTNDHHGEEKTYNFVMEDPKKTNAYQGEDQETAASPTVNAPQFSVSVNHSGETADSSADLSDDFAGEASDLPDGVDLSEAHMGRSIKSGAFGSVSWVEGAKGTPPLVIKVPVTPARRKELEHEAKVYAHVGPHENIATCLGMQSIDGEEGLVLEAVKGGDMRKVMDQLEKLSKASPEAAKQSGMDRALTHAEYTGTMQYMLRETLKGLAFLEEKGVVHADIRPDNVMCDSGTGEVKIVDFGLAHASGKQQQTRILPYLHGMVAPEEATSGKIVNSNADVFAAGEMMRMTVEGDQFRYNNKSKEPSKWDAKEFGEADPEGKYKQSLNPMPSTPPEVGDGGKASPEGRIDHLNSRIKKLLKDPLLKKNPAVIKLGNDINSASRNAERASENLDEKAIETLEARLGVVERSFKTSGGYRAETSYTEFVNWAMHPDPSHRPSAKEALEHPFLQESLLDDEQARQLLKRMLSPAQQPQPPDSGGDSSTNSSTSSPGSANPAAEKNPVGEEPPPRMDTAAMAVRSAAEKGELAANVKELAARRRPANEKSASGGPPPLPAFNPKRKTEIAARRKAATENSGSGGPPPLPPFDPKKKAEIAARRKVADEKSGSDGRPKLGV